MSTSQGYKVCKEINSHYYSAVVYPFGRVEYLVGETVTPADNCGPLTVFRTRQSALDWIDDWVGDDENARANYALFRCEYTPSTENVVYYINPEDSSPRGAASSFVQQHCPAGTILASDVKLISEVNWE